MKWKAQGSTLLSEARQRSELASSVRNTRQFISATAEMSTAAMSVLSRLITSPKMHAAMKHAAETQVAIERMIGMSMPAALPLGRLIASPEMQAAMNRTATAIERTIEMSTLAAPALRRLITSPDVQAAMNRAAETQAAIERTIGMPKAGRA